MRGPWRWGSFTENPEGYLKEGSGNWHHHRDFVGESGGGSFNGDFEIRQEEDSGK